MPKKLSRKDYDRMWGEDGPYSQVRLCEEIRILDGSVSRVFLLVEAEVNPFTFEYVRKNRRQFSGDEPVLQLLDHSENRGKFGYVVSAGEVELRDEGSRGFARKQADMTTEALIRMHKFVMNEFSLGHNSDYVVLKDRTSPDRFVWNAGTGRVEPADEEVWGKTTLIGSPAGVRNNKVRFFIVFAFKEKADFKKKSAKLFAETLQATARKFQVDIENCEALMAHVLITALLPFDIAPTSFIEAVLAACNGGRKYPLFQKDYLVTNVKKPSPEQIMSFLGQLPLDEDRRIIP